MINNQRQQFPKTVLDIMDKDERVVVLLGDIGVYAFKEVFAKYPTRCYNVGILEQSMVGMAAGLAMAGFIPIIHTIEPFLVDRAFEQIKIDFGYQGLKGNIVGVDVSESAPNLGYTHQCPYALRHMGDVKGMNVYAPVTADELNEYLKKYYDKGLNYFRIS
jgi:transketolase